MIYKFMGLFNWLNNAEIKEQNKIKTKKLSPLKRFESKIKGLKWKQTDYTINGISRKQQSLHVDVKLIKGFNKEEITKIIEHYKLRIFKEPSNKRLLEKLDIAEMFLYNYNTNPKEYLEKFKDLEKKLEQNKNNNRLTSADTPEINSLPTIAAKKWVNINCRIFHIAEKNLTRQQNKKNIKKSIKRLKKFVENIGLVIEPNKEYWKRYAEWEQKGSKGRFYIDKLLQGKPVGFSNPELKELSFQDYCQRLNKNLMELKYEINSSFKIVRNVKKSRDDIWIKVKIGEKPKEKRDIERDSFVEIPPFKENWNYSPIEFINNKDILYELTNQISAFGLEPAKVETNYMGFNKNGEPTILIIRGVMIIEYLVKDRIELMKNCPEIDKECFGNYFRDFIEENSLEKDMGEHTQKWLDKVRQLLKHNDA